MSEQFALTPVDVQAELAPALAAPVAGLAPLSDIPALSSNPTAFAKLYLDFDGDPNSHSTPVYDRDGDPTTFSDSEITAIREIWSRVAEKYSPFNINVTTVNPGNLNRLETLRVLIGGNGAWAGSGMGGVAGVGEFYDLITSNTVWVFPKNLNNGAPKSTAEVTTHESGHGFGLRHQSLYSGTSLQKEYNPGDATRAPIMGNSINSARGLWWYGPTPVSSTTYQDDLAVLAGSKNAFGYRPDDHGNTALYATPLTVSGTTVAAAGIIEQSTDADYFVFSSGAGQVSFTAAVAQYGPMLDLKLELRDYSDNILASADTATLGETITTTVPAGIYYLVVKSHGNYGDLGQFTVSGTVIAGGPSYPIARPGGPYSVPEAGAVSLNGSNSTGSALTYAWDLDADGIFGETGGAAARGDETGATPVFSALGLDGPLALTVSLRITDDQGRSHISATTLNVLNVAPTLTLSGSNSINEGSRYTLQLTWSDPGADALSSWLIAWGDGVVQLIAGATPSVQHTYADNGNYVISVSAADGDGTFAAAPKSLIVNNVAPAIALAGAASVNEGSTYTLTLGAITDPGADAVASWIVDWGDGQVQTFASGGNKTHLYTDGPLAANITVALVDEDGTHASAASRSVAVNNVAPVLSLSGNASALEGATYTLGLWAADPGADAITAWLINWGDGMVQPIEGNPASVQHQYVDNGDYTIDASATDADGTYQAPGKILAVANVPPSLVVSGSGSVKTAVDYTLTLASTDPGNDVIASWLMDWGDGTIQLFDGNLAAAAHAYAGAGSYTISVSASDEDGTYDADPATVLVQASYPDATADPANLTSAGDGPYLFTVRYAGDLDTATLDAQDILVEGPNGFSQLAGFVSVQEDTPNGWHLAVYELAAPGGLWDPADNGTYTLSLQAAQVAGLSGDTAPAATLGTFLVDITPQLLASVPTAALAAADLRYGGGSTYTFTVTYDDQQGVNESDLDNSDIVATNAAGFRQSARFISAAVGGDGIRRIATYSFTAPGGYWDPSDNNTYSFWMRGGQVSNLAGNFVASEILGSLTVRLTDDQAGDSTANAAAISLPAGKRKNVFGYVSRSERYDVYSFNLDGPGKLTAQLSGLLDSAEVRLLNSKGRDITPTAQYGLHPRYFVSNLQAGRYFVYVGLLGRRGTAYWLQLRRTAFSTPPAAGTTPTRQRTVFAAMPKVANSYSVASTTNTVLGAKSLNGLFNSQTPVLANP